MFDVTSRDGFCSISLDFQNDSLVIVFHGQAGDDLAIGGDDGLCLVGGTDHEAGVKDIGEQLFEGGSAVACDIWSDISAFTVHFVALTADFGEDGFTGDGVSACDEKFVAHASDEFLSGGVTFCSDGAPVSGDEVHERLVFEQQHFAGLVGVDITGLNFAVAYEFHELYGRRQLVREDFDGCGANIGGQCRGFFQQQSGGFGSADATGGEDNFAEQFRLRVGFDQRAGQFFCIRGAGDDESIQQLQPEFGVCGLLKFLPSEFGGICGLSGDQQLES